MILSARGALVVTLVTLGCLPDDWMFRSTMDAASDAVVEQADGCGASTQTDPANCGACGNVCPTATTGSATCLRGICGIVNIATYRVGLAPHGLAVDSTGGVWVANQNADSASNLAPDGSLRFTVPGLHAPFGVGVARDDTVWVTNFTTNTAVHLDASGHVMRTVSTNGSEPAHVAFDRAGNVWIGNYASGTLTELTPAGDFIGTYAGVGHPQYITFDAAGNAWVGEQYSGSIAEFDATGNLLGSVSAGGGDPDSIAFDPAGNLWVTNFGELFGTTVTELNPVSGAILGTYASGGTAPYKIAFDRHGNAWICNDQSGNVVEICGTTACGAVGSILATYPVGANPIDLTIDAAGNVWTANAGDNSVTRLFGVAL